MHWVSNPLPSTEDVCAGQSLHVASAIAAAAVLYLPREHSVQAADPFSFLYVPAVHTVHATPSEPVYPWLQIQSVFALLPASENMCVGQSLHVDSEVSAIVVEYLPSEQRLHGNDPFTSLYVPAIHAMHSKPSGPV